MNDEVHSEPRVGVTLNFDEEGLPADSYPVSEPRAGGLCPKCQKGKLDYDGLLNLTCPQCGYTAGGCFT